MKNYNKTIDKILDAQEKSLSKLGREYRKEVLIPLCKERRLTFFHGVASNTGDFIFYAEDKTYKSSDSDFIPWLEPIFSMLKTEVGLNKDFGLYVEEVLEKDLK